MSDPMTNVDAEDLLASIRRLVEETHSSQRQKATEPASSHTPTSADPAALVLSPDLRVVQSPEMDAQSQSQSQSGSEVAPDVAQDAAVADDAAPFVLSMDQAVALPEEPAEAPQVAQDSDIETQMMDDAPEAAEVAETHDAADAVDVSAEVQSVAAILEESTGHADEEASDDWSAGLDDTPDAVAAAQVEHMSLEERIAELEAAVGAQSDAGEEWEPDGSEDLSAEIPKDMPVGFDGSEASVLHFRAPQQKDADPMDDATSQEAPEVPEAAAEISDAEIIEETSGSESAVETTVEAEQAEAVEVPAFDDNDAPDLDEDLSPAGYPDDEIMDEEALREMVSQAIRDELQGAMGERITRNLRRLVRREVQRAMTLRDFD